MAEKNPFADTNLEGIMKELGGLPGVVGTMIMNLNGLPIRTTFKDAEAIHYAALISEFVRKCKSSVEHDIMQNRPITIIRIRSHKNEIIIVPDSKNEFILVVVQDALATV